MSRDPKSAGLIRPPGVAEDAILRVLRVPAEAAGMRLDVFVQSQLRHTSRTRARAIIERSAYSPSGRRLAASDRVHDGDLVALWRAPFEGDEEQPPLPVIYEDAHLLVIDKPPLVTVHPTARYHRHTVKKRLEVERPGEFLALIHRLDRETSGLLLLARNEASERAFKAMLEVRSLSAADADDPDELSAEPRPEPAAWQAERSAGEPSEPLFEKEYLAITRGAPTPGLVESPLELDPDNALRVKMRVCAPGNGLPARTGVELLEQRPGYALVRCALHTGRQHQIRVHLAALGCPVVGDKLYGADERLLARAADGQLTPEDLALLELPRHALHAHCYRLRHAMTGETLELVSPLPADLDAFWQGLAR